MAYAFRHVNFQRGPCTGNLFYFGAKKCRIFSVFPAFDKYVRRSVSAEDDDDNQMETFSLGCRLWLRHSFLGGGRDYLKVGSPGGREGGVEGVCSAGPPPLGVEGRANWFQSEGNTNWPIPLFSTQGAIFFMELKIDPQNEFLLPPPVVIKFLDGGWAVSPMCLW